MQQGFFGVFFKKKKTNKQTRAFLQTKQRRNTVSRDSRLSPLFTYSMGFGAVLCESRSSNNVIALLVFIAGIVGAFVHRAYGTLHVFTLQINKNLSSPCHPPSPQNGSDQANIRPVQSVGWFLF